VAVDALVEAQTTRTARLQARVKELVAAAWAALPGVDDTALDQWLATVLPVVTGAEATAAADMAAYLALLVAEMTGQPPRYIGVPTEAVTGARLRRGTPPEAVYSRPMIQARTLLAQKLPYAEAMQGAGRRAELLAATDVQSARLYGAQAIMATEPRIVGYRRKLTGTHSCGLCVVASTRRYHKADLMPRHPGCDCTPTPIIGTEDPGEVLNRPLLDQMHAAIAERFGPEAVTLSADSDAYRQLVTVYQHGEYGPTLAVAGDHHLTSAAANAR
jgi:hypothetical protein